ncbi:MAG TPA: hypothetical protein VJU78_06455 [Chitinophagaceae bacterium]|nr:hypothetical protein [Chitinophagaceae bacterium]
MKTLKLLVFLLFIPLVFHAQKSLTGLWVGTLSNDSTTVRKDQSFEIALTQYKEKVYGYSRMNFIINDTLYYIVKRVKGTIENDICEVTDDDIITHNFPRRPDKGVKLISTFRRNLQDSVWRLDGEWKTTESKRHRYYSISGKISLKSEPDIEKSKIFPHLEELKLADDIAFYKESKKANQQSVAANQNVSIADTKSINNNKKEEKKQSAESAIAKTEIQKSSAPLLTTNTTVQQHKKDPNDKNSINEIKTQENIAKRNETTPVSEEAVAFTGIKKSDLPASNLPVEQKKNVTGNIPKPEVKNQGANVKVNEAVAVISEPKTEIKKTDPAIIAKSNEETKIINKDISRPEVKSSFAAAFVQQRKTVAPQILEFKSDSLELKLYDNGEIDGDTVSILLNGEILLAKQGLKTSAIKKTIYIQPGSDEITLVLYAENLGKYPPNTGLLVVHDGEDMYQVRFSADLQQNAAIVLRRKK